MLIVQDKKLLRIRKERAVTRRQLQSEQEQAAYATLPVLTKAQIWKRYPGQFVLVANPELDSQLEAVRGQVLIHLKTRSAFDQALVALDPKPSSAAIVFTGKPKKMIYAL